MKFSVATLLEVVNYTTQSDTNKNQLVCVGLYMSQLATEQSTHAM